MIWVEVGVAIAIVIGIAGLIVPIVPGSIVVWAAIGVWALVLGEPLGWVVFVLASLVLVVGTVVKYLIPGRKMKADGIPNLTMWIGALGAVIGFFVIPVVGVFVGFPVGIYAAEYQRVGRDQAWGSTVSALKAVGISMLIEMAACTLAGLVWFAGVLAT